MTEKRRFKRYRFRAGCSLTHNNISYTGQTENISVNGALLSFNDGIVIPQDERCRLNIHLEGQALPLKLEIVVRYSNFTMLGIQFASVEDAAREVLGELIEHLKSVEDCAADEPLNRLREYE